MKWSHLGQNSNSYFLVFMHKYNYRACCVRKNGITYSGGDLPCRAMLRWCATTISLCTCIFG